MRVSVTLLAALMALGTAQAEDITFTATGRIVWAPDPTLQGLFVNPVSVGDEVRIFYTFESTTPVWYLSDYHAEYPAISAFRVEVSGNVWAFPLPVSANNRIIVENDYYDPADSPATPYHDTYQAAGYLNKAGGGFSGVLLAFNRFQASTPVPALSSLQLPLLPPDPASFTQSIVFLHNCCDAGGNAAQVDVEISTLRRAAQKSPAQLLVDLAQTVVEINVHAGITNSMDAKLDNAIAALDGAKANDLTIAIAMLEAFINEVNAQRGKKLTEAQADLLAGQARVIIDALNQP